METRIVCPNCGTNFKLPEHESVCLGRTIGKDSNMGIIYLQPEEYERERKPYIDKVKMLGEALGRSYGSESIQEASDKAIEELLKWESNHKKENANMNSINTTSTTNNNNVKENKTMTKNEERLETLKKSGVDISKYFNVALPNGDEVIMELVNGVPTPANIPTFDDEIRQSIIDDGYVRNTRLHRRFVMAQMFRMINNSNSKYHDGYNKNLDRLGYMYQFEMLVDELHTQKELYARDKATYEERNSFFDKTVAVKLCEKYIKDVNWYLSRRAKKKCKGVPYIRINRNNIFCDDINKKIIYPLKRLSLNVANSSTPEQLYVAFKDFYYKAKKIKLNYSQLEEWRDAYKGAGAYYTLRNMVQFHNCHIVDYETGEVYASGISAVKYLESKVSEYKGEGWRFMAMLRKCIADNNFTFGR